MKLTELLLISIGLASDAFAVSVCKGLSMKKYSIKKGIIVGTYFGIFQGLMPFLGYILGNNFKNIVENINHWIAFFLLGIIGIDMIKESFNENNEFKDEKLDFKTMFPLSIATSIDAFSVGITFAFLEVNIFYAILLITIITLMTSTLGTKIGNLFGSKYEKKSQILGGLILIFIGAKILLEHLII